MKMSRKEYMEKWRKINKGMNKDVNYYCEANESVCFLEGDDESVDNENANNENANVLNTTNDHNIDTNFIEGSFVLFIDDCSNYMGINSKDCFSKE